MTKEEIKEEFANLIDLNGEKDELETFQYCSEKGLELAGSTIDKIVKTPNGNIVFYYNENTNDFDTFNAFDEDDLSDFLKDLADAIFDDQRDTIAEYISDKMSWVIEDGSDRNTFAENIVDGVMDDIRETADLIHWNICDVEIALARVLIEMSDNYSCNR